MALRQWLADLRHEWHSFADAYPRFVTDSSAGLEGGEVPVFVFHTIEPALFERQLRYLCDNGYRTITTRQFIERMSGANGGDGREVLLTIDDARSSTWRYALPLLQRYECRATSFVIPAWTPDTRGALRQTLADVWAGRATANQVVAADPDDLQVCSWAELKIMQDSGAVDVQSHSWSHRRAFTPSPLRGVFMAGARCAPFDLPYSPYLTSTTRFDEVRDEHYFGLPLFDSRSVLGGEALWRLRRDVMERCRAAYVELARDSANGRWHSQLLQRVSALTTDANCLEEIPPAEAQRQVVDEVVGAREKLRERLGVEANVLCLPFGEGSDTVVDELRRMNVQACFWSARPGRSTNRPGDDLGGIVRIKNDFIWRLPGKGRRSLARIYGDKIARRLRGEVPY